MLTTAITLGTQNSSAEDVNEAGQLVGYSTVTGEEHAMSWSVSEGVTDLGRLPPEDGFSPGCAFSRAHTVNASGRVAGESQIVKGNLCFHHGFMWTRAGGMVNLGTLEGGVSIADRVNDKGRVFGWSHIDPNNLSILPHVTMWQTAFVIALPDIDLDGTPDIGLLREDPSQLEILSGATRGLLTQLPFLGSAYIPVGAATIPDSDGDGIAELAVLAGRISDSRMLIQIRNLGATPGTRNIRFAEGHTPLGIAAVGDPDGNGIPDLAVLSSRRSDGRGLVEIRNAFGSASTREFWVRTGQQPRKLVAVDDADQNGVAEIAVMSTRNADGRIAVEVLNAAGAPNPRSIWFSGGRTAIDLAAMGDADEDGSTELALLTRRPADNRYIVEVRNAFGAPNTRSFGIRQGYRPLSVLSVGDADGDTVPEFATLSHRDYDARALFEVQNAAGPKNYRTLGLAARLRAGELILLNRPDNSAVYEVLALMTRSNGRILGQSRSVSGAEPSRIYSFSQ